LSFNFLISLHSFGENQNKNHGSTSSISKKADQRIIDRNLDEKVGWAGEKVQLVDQGQCAV
jgi:hypothetical protein